VTFIGIHFDPYEKVQCVVQKWLHKQQKNVSMITFRHWWIGGRHALRKKVTILRNYVSCLYCEAKQILYSKTLVLIWITSIKVKVKLPLFLTKYHIMNTHSLLN